ncbi:MAG: DUF86 domain-containing protein [candidate division WOR-3 bacterium]|nr:DUF86 domain-containing protein [candidate division WOR-3 bacterium]
MLKDDAVYIGHMLDMSRQARELVAEKTRADYDADVTLRLALAHLVQNIGEAARRVSPQIQKTHPDIPWRNIVGIRHKVVHDYFYVDYDIIWDVVTADLPALMTRLEQIAGTA